MLLQQITCLVRISGIAGLQQRTMFAMRTVDIVQRYGRKV